MRMMPSSYWDILHFYMYTYIGHQTNQQMKDRKLLSILLAKLAKSWYLNDEDNLVRSRSSEALLMSPRIHTTHRLTVSRNLQDFMMRLPFDCEKARIEDHGWDELGKPQTSPTLLGNEAF